MPVWLNLPLIHAGGPEPSGWLHSDWRPVPTVVLGSLLIIGVYAVLTGSRNRDADGHLINPVSISQRICFMTGVLTVFIALNPPLDDWSGHFLLSAHMLQHFILMLISMPLLIIGTPPWLLSKIIALGPIRNVGYYLTRPVISYVLANAIVVLWHFPFAYDAALQHEAIHVLQHMSFLAAAFFTWWPVLGRNSEWPGLGPLMGCLYLFLTSIPGQAIGAFITLADPGLYAVYPDAPRLWGISLKTDQEFAGLMMWVISGLVYFGFISIIFLRWAIAEEGKDRQSNPPPSTSPVHS